ncbi:MAG: membrane or secreted protein [Cyclobacteriaceae bacterium]
MKSYFILIVAAALSGYFEPSMSKLQAQTLDLKGAWQTELRGNQITMICSQQYFSVSIYDFQNKKFEGTHGGSYKVEGNELIALIEFHSMNPELVGNVIRSRIDLQNNTLTVNTRSEMVPWKQIDDGTPGQLAGAWFITGRIRNGQMGKMNPGARRTMKILSGTRFQWIAYNVETKEFSGTGGGSYTSEGGKYAESIEFFSRDSSKVGQTLNFDFSLNDGNWQHKGLSSKGEAIDEVWAKREKLGL